HPDVVRERLHGTAERKQGAGAGSSFGVARKPGGAALHDRLRADGSRNRDDPGDDIMSVSPMRVSAVIAAGGSGARLGGPRPQQFLDLGGEPILARSLRAFVAHASVDEVIVT